MHDEAAQLGGTRSLSDSLVEELRLYLPFVVLTIVYVAAVRLVAGAAGLDSLFTLELYSSPMLASALLAIFFGVVAYTGYLGLVVRERHPIGRMLREFSSNYLVAPMLVRLIVCLAVLPLFVSAFTSFKGMIPLLHHFQFDHAAAEADRILHFGIDPWRITHALFGGVIPTFAIAVVYNAWFIILWLFVAYHLFWIGDRRAAARYLLAWVLCWIVVGSIFALLLSSAGPAFYGRVADGPDLFAPLMARLHYINDTLAAMHFPDPGFLREQAYIWSRYTNTETTLGSGISAMPSMHVSMAVLMALRARHIHRRLGWLMWGFAALIMIGSVHLAWHYAVDGYVAALLTVVLWVLAGKLVDLAAGERELQPAR